MNFSYACIAENYLGASHGFDIGCVWLKLFFSELPTGRHPGIRKCYNLTVSFLVEEWEHAFVKHLTANSSDCDYKLISLLL